MQTLLIFHCEAMASVSWLMTKVPDLKFFFFKRAQPHPTLGVNLYSFIFLQWIFVSQVSLSLLCKVLISCMTLAVEVTALTVLTWGEAALSYRL